MERLIEQLKTLFGRKFPGATAELEQARPLRHVGGFLVWDGFEGVEQLGRQRQLRQVIREARSAEDQAQLTTILTVTLAEVAVMREG